MAAKKVDIQALALETLTRAFADPTPRPLLGTAKAPGYFLGSTQAVKDASALCRERGWLLGTGEWVGSGKSKKEKFRLTPAGIQAALEQSPTLHLLQGVADAVKRQTLSLSEQHAALRQLTEQVEPLREAVAALARRVEPPNLDEIARRLAAATTPSVPTTTPPSSPPPSPPRWLELVVALADEQRARDRHQPPSLPDVYAQIRQLQPDLTLGQFHDGLRTLRDEGRIRLLPFTRALPTIPDLRNALFIDGEVMFYVDLA